MTRIEDDLRTLLERRTTDPPGNADRIEQVRGRIRRTRRRRQAAASGVLALAIAGVAVGLSLPGHGSTASVVPATPSAPAPTQAPVTPSPPSRPGMSAPAPTVDYGLAALAGNSPMALNVATGDIVTFNFLAANAAGRAVGLSHDGRYIAAIADAVGALQVTATTGHQALSVPTGVKAAAWSPVADRLAVVSTGPSAITTLYDVVADPAGYYSRQIARTVTGGADTNPGLVWSTDGQRLAVGSGHTLTMLTASGRVIASKTFGAQQYPKPARWSGDGSHLVVFVRSQSASLDADGVQVVDLDASGHQVGTLPPSLAYPDWWHPLAGSAVLGTLGGDREVARGKTVARCDLDTALCTTLAGDSTTSAFGAVATATGIAYLVAENVTGVQPPSTASFLRMAGQDGSGAHPAPGAPATVNQIVGGADGHTVLLVGADATGSPGIYRYDGVGSRLLTTVPPGDVGPGTATGYYGHVTEIVSWRQPRP